MIWKGGPETGGVMVAVHQPSSSIFMAFPDGRLTVEGPLWKSCPRPEKPCPRHGRDGMPEAYEEDNKKCQTCTYKGVAHLDDQKMAIEVADRVAEQCEEAA